MNSKFYLVASVFMMFIFLTTLANADSCCAVSGKKSKKAQEQVLETTEQAVSEETGTASNIQTGTPIVPKAS